MYDRLAAAQPVQPAKIVDELQSKFHTKRARRRLIRTVVIVANLAVIAGVGFVVLGGNGNKTAAAPALLSSNTTPVTAANPLDQLSSADVAATVADVTSVPEKPSVISQAQTDHALLAMASSSDSVATKPQVFTTPLKSRADIQHYTVQSGDTISSIAAKLGVSSNSVRWSNGLSGDAVTVGDHLVVPPTGWNGIVYTVKAGDTAASLAAKYKSDAAKITAFNDAEISGLKVGEVILIPDGSIVAAPTYSYSSYGVGATIAWGFVPQYGGNGYDYGYCTWYVASRIAVPNNWGNANTWAYYAAAEGWTVSSVPRAGAIAQTPYGYDGHVAIVEAVSADGTQIKYSDMNGIAGWGRVGYSGWVSASTFPHYIYH
ncbi:MAG TPA: LysM peptidoglycan-binding domain-containing protein [Candidatus Saccharimonadales bacterium]|nr:LysM peptidoglycan-binding domain-containing protein [Candidatus Saccharimonadales bacterium]